MIPPAVSSFLESQAQEVRAFDSNGVHRATFGGKGGGPGEFENAFGIMQTSRGLLYVPDQRNARISVLSPDSGFLRSYPLTLLRWGFVCRTGEGWSATPGDPAYRIVRMTLSGDTTLVLETQRSPLPVTASERDSAMDAIYDGLAQYGVTKLDASKIPELKPTVLGLSASDAGELWVHTSSADSLRRYDVYSRGGEYRGSVATNLNVVTYVKPVVRGDEFHAVVSDEFDIPYVVRARIVRNERPE